MGGGRGVVCQALDPGEGDHGADGQEDGDGPSARAVRLGVDKATMQEIKDKGLALLELIDGVGSSRELSIAKTKTEEAVMWAVKHVTA